MQSEEIDFIVVGAGLAGCVLAHHLLLTNKKIIIVNNPQLSSCSQIAGGLYNPITGKKNLKTWSAEKIFPYLEDFYKKIESLTGINFLFPLPIIVPIQSIEEQNMMQGKTADNEFQNIKIQVNAPNPQLDIDNPLGTFTSNYSGYLDVELFVKTSWSYFEKLGIIISSNISTEEIRFDEEIMTWKAYQFKKIIFCEGVQAINNQLFNWLPFTPNKGELFKIKINDFDKKNIYRKKIFILPMENGEYKCGSTYVFNSTNEAITEEGFNELSKHLEDLIKREYLVTNHLAGVRPAARDRRPFIGAHPKHKDIYIFNGLGSKGVSLAPYFAKELTECLIHNAPIDKEVNIERYYHWYENQA
ncbi:MAG: FAD-binding oxidoreductase [Cytophagales bacterium]|nr:MAG: FAD-binding oxidoreductase [Cytophagales bacterium]